MITDYSTLNLFDKPLFSRIDMQTPFNDTLPIPSSACFCYVLEGDNKYIDKQSNITASKDNIIFSLCGITMGNILSNQQSGKMASIIVHLLPEHLNLAFADSKPKDWQDIDSPVSKYVVQIATNRLIDNYIIGIDHFFENQAAITNELLLIKLKELITLLLQTDSSPNILKMVRSLFSEREFTFKKLIETHLFEPLSVRELSALTGMSLTSFKKNFKEIFNDTPSSYIIGKRTEEVAKRLMVSDLPINQIGYEVGFTSPAHLSRCFKEKYGTSPSKYKGNFSVKK